VLATGIRMAEALPRTVRALGFLALVFVTIALLRCRLVPVLFTLAPLSVPAAWVRRR
jgi:hypothetical protein